jgi:glucose-1-phosphate cytidylyltransferase
MNISEFKKNLSALILCGGRGERLKPLTNILPKPLIKIDNKEILSYILTHIKSYQVKNNLVLSGYKHNLLNKFVKKKFDTDVKCIYTGQDVDILKRIKKSLMHSRKFILICYGDTLLDIDINKLIRFHQKNKHTSTMSIFETKTNFGIVKFDSNNIITKFAEKPNLNLWINVGYFIFDRDELIKFSSKFSTFKHLLNFLGKNSKIKVFKHRGKHITINSAVELDVAKKKIKSFKK